MITLRKALVWVFWGFIAWCFLQSTLPTIGGDPCRTIMYAPKWYLSHGIQFNPWFDSYQWYEMLAFHIMRFIPDPGSILSTMFMVLAALTIWDMAERYAPDSLCAGPLAALLYVSMPMSRLCSFYSLTEHAMVFLFLLGLNGALRFSETKRPHWLVVGGLCAGSACGVDVNALIPSMLLVVLAGRGWWIMLTAFAIAALPWYGMNIIWFGNPIFPHHENWFGWTNWGIYEGMTHDIVPGDIYEAMETAPHKTLFSILIWICAPLFWVTEYMRQPRENTRAHILIAFVVIMLAYWLLFERIAHARFWMPMLAVLALMGGIGIPRRGPATIAFGILIITYLVFVTIPSVPASMPMSRIERAQYISNQKPGYPSIMAVNQNAPGCRAYLLDLRDYRFYCDFDIGGHWTGPESATHFLAAEDKHEWLTDRGYNMLIVNIFPFGKSAELLDLKLPYDKFRIRPPYTVIEIYELIAEKTEETDNADATG